MVGLGILENTSSRRGCLVTCKVFGKVVPEAFSGEAVGMSMSMASRVLGNIAELISGCGDSFGGYSTSRGIDVIFAAKTLNAGVNI